MKPFWRRKKDNLVYKFLCKTCDIFFEKDFPYQNQCPVCNRTCELYEVYEKKG